MLNNTVFIGGKPTLNYVTALVTQFTTKNAKEVIVRARGKFISSAVDVVEITKRRFMNNMVIKETELGSEDHKNKEGKPIKVSTIKITAVLEGKT